MMSSIDGRLITDRWTSPASGIDDDTLFQHYDEIAEKFHADGWMVGRKSMQYYAQGTPRIVKSPIGDRRETHIAERKGRSVAVALDPHGKLHYGQDNAEGDHIVAILGEYVSDQYLAELQEDGVSYLFAGPGGHDLPLAMETLYESFGVKTILLEGGGIMNGAFLKAGLIDEISLLIYPGIDGLAGIPSIFEYLGETNEKPAATQSLRHVATETLAGGMVWLWYKLENISC